MNLYAVKFAYAKGGENRARTTSNTRETGLNAGRVKVTNRKYVKSLERHPSTIMAEYLDERYENHRWFTEAGEGVRLPGDGN